MINYQATDQYGGNFRQPSALTQDGGAAYNGFGMYDGQPNARPDGRPPGQPNYDPSQTGTPQSFGSAQTGGAPGSIGNTLQGGQQMTFAQMQQQGMARPPMPGASASVDPSQMAGLQAGMQSMLPQSPYQAGSPTAPNTFFNYSAPAQGTQTPGYSNNPQAWTNTFQQAGQPSTTAPSGIQPYPQAPSTGSPYNVPPVQTPGVQPVQGGDLASQIQNQYQNYQGTGAFQAPGSPLTGQTQQAAQQMLNNPSPYLIPAFQSQLQQQLGSIDDQYNTSNQAIQNNLAGRGLAQDGSIGLSDVRYNNLQKRTAQTDATTNLYNQLAQTYGADRANAIAAASGVQGQQFGQAQSAYGTNLTAANQNFNQQQQALQSMLGYGQQGFNNQLATQGANNQQDNANTQLMLQLLGYTGA